MKITLVAAMARSRIIGRDGGMPWHLPADLAHFKRVTVNHPVVMGRKTFQSIGFALPRRRNIVITRQPNARFEGAEAAASLDEALRHLGSEESVMIIGGGQLYREALPMADAMELTFIDADVDGDTRFPEWSESEWREVSNQHRPADEGNPHDLRFVRLERVGR